MSPRLLSEERITAMAYDASTAPSMHNAQPWHFRYHRHDRGFVLHADLGATMPHADPSTRGLHIGCGAALLNLRVAVAHAGWHPETRLLPIPGEPGLLATVRLARPGEGDSGLSELYPAVHRRHTSRYPYEETDLPEEVRAALAEAAGAEGVSLDFPAPWHLRWVLDLVQEAEARNLTDRGQAQDLDEWTRTGPAATATEDGGVPDYAFGPRKVGGKAPMRDFAGDRPVPGRETAKFERHPHLALLSTPGDKPVDWLRAGQAMERVLLRATLEGLVGSPATQALEWPDLRWPLRDPLFGSGHVQMVLRLGYGPQGPSTPRRPIREILDIEP
ncbi:Acg family FMN-binding oxidoreductase [Streptomyces pathocidini]|uniref:Acg family FMN-binding oxidoreductase n=1 Tax=Streptomyces pathocidini TaxID=1650571 RepID=A0ABW7UV41_9ACTN|nr:nitroreductase [Streptomyces pathocidini]